MAEEEKKIRNSKTSNNATNININKKSDVANIKKKNDKETEKKVNTKITTKKQIKKETSSDNKKRIAEKATKKENKPQITETTSTKRTTRSIENKTKEGIKKQKPKNIKKQSKKEDERIKQIIAEQLINIEKMEDKPEKNRKIEQEKINLKHDKNKSQQKVNKKIKYDPEKIAKTIENKKKLPKEEKRKLYKKMFTNIMIACAITIYLIFVNLGFLNIKPEIFVTDLEVFSISLIVVTIIIFEKAYKKDNDTIAIFGIETLLLAIITLISMYIFKIYPEKYMLFIVCFGILFDIYYIIKSIVTYVIGKKIYRNSVSDVKEIVEEE